MLKTKMICFYVRSPIDSDVVSSGGHQSPLHVVGRLLLVPHRRTSGTNTIKTILPEQKAP